ncbi:MAG: hypothetical protein ACR2QU_06570 [Gammaproteobacteria bacterium]
MKSTTGKGVLAVLTVMIVCFLTIEFAEARRGGGSRGGGRSMHRGGPAAGGSMQRSRTRPQSQNRGTQNRDFSRENRPAQRPEQSQRQQRDQQDRDDRYDQRQDNIDRRHDQIDERQEFAKDVHNERKEWYEDNWRRGGTYISISSWNSMNCRYTTVYRNGMTQYNCNGVYYERVYRGGQVVYVVTN